MITRRIKQLFFQSCEDGCLTIVHQLLNQHPDLKAQINSLKDNDGNAALIIASLNRDTDIVILLLENGAQVDITDTDGWTILMMVSEMGYSDVVKLLLDKGAQVDFTNTKFYGWTALMIASQDGHANVVKLLLDKGAQVDIADIDARTALMMASDYGSAEVVKLLLDKGAQVDTADIDGRTALVIASQNGQEDVAKLLLDGGARTDIQDNKGATALIIASQNGHANVVRLLINKKAQVNLKDINGTTALMLAAMNGNTDVVKLLLEAGASVDVQNHNGFTALMLASEYGHIDIVKMLLNKGSTTAIQFDDGYCALVAASRNGHAGIVKLLLPVNGKFHRSTHKRMEMTALRNASHNGHTNIVKLLLDADESIVNSPDGRIALLEAVHNRHIDVVKLLIDKGAELDIAEIDGWTALMMASTNRHMDLVKLLLDKGAQVDIADPDGRTALMIAIRGGYEDVVNLLLDKGAQADTAEMYGVTALMIACEKGYSEVVKLLLDKGAKVDIESTYGLTALIAACESGHTDIVKLLLKHGALINQQNSDGISPLMRACRFNHTGVVKALIEHGAQIDLQDHDGWSPLMAASMDGYSEIVKLLLENDAHVNLQSEDGNYALKIASKKGYIEIVNQLLSYGGQADLKDSMGRSAIAEARNIDMFSELNTNVLKIQHIPQNPWPMQNELFDEKEQEQHLIAIENAIQDRGQLDHTLVHGVFVGPPRSGKDSLMKRLLGEKIINSSPSTGVAENVVHVKVEESSTFAATVDPSNWTRLAYDEEALHLLKTTSNKSSNSKTELSEEDGDENIIAETNDLILKETDGASHQIQEERAQNNMTRLMSQFTSPSEKTLQIPVHLDSLPASQHKSPMEIFKEALKNKGLEGLKKQLLKSWSLYLTNTGGQMEFQELLPLLVSGPSIFFITFQLHKHLNQHFSVEYELPSGKSSKSYQSSINILESILQTLSSISAMGTYVYKGLQREAVPLRPKVFIIGTHKDLLDKKSAKTEIKRIDQHLQDVIKPTSHFQDGIIQFTSESQMIFTVNNHDPDDSDFHRIRNSVEKVVETGDYRMRSPAHWMIYSLVVRQLQNRVESYDECLAIAKECGIRDVKEFNEALHFIHTKMGLIRYFPHEQLKKIIIVDPQILFEKVTELIVETFTFDKICDYSKLEIFKNMGIFNLSDFKRISSRTGQNLTPPLFVKLLEYLRIAARFQQSGETKYFLPCALTHAQVKQSDDISTIPPLIVTFQCGYCPKGLFGILITYLINNEMESNFEWELDTEKIYRDEVCFQVGPYDTVTVRLLPTHLEVKLVECDPEISRINCTVEGICQEICQSVEKGIKTATSAINYINAQHLFTFYCTSENCSKDPHPAKLKKLKRKLCSLKCDKVNKVLPLPSGYEKWQLDSSPQISKGTTSLPHLFSQYTDSGTRLEKQHLTLLYGQLSGHASKWREIGIYLKFRNNELDTIAAEPSLYHEGTKGFLREMLSGWLEWAPGDQRGSEQYATLGTLKTAVSSAGLGATAADLTILQQQQPVQPQDVQLMT